MATTSSSHNQYNLPWWSQWWPYLLVLVILLLFPFIAGLTIGDPEAVSEGASFIEALVQRTESGYAKVRNALSHLRTYR